MTSLKTSLSLCTLACAMISGPILAKPAKAAKPVELPAIPQAPVLALPDSQETAPTQDVPQKPKMGEGVIAIVNDTLISSYDLRQRLILLAATSGIQLNDSNLQTYEQQALRDLIDEKLRSAEIAHYEVKVDDREINQELGRMASQANMTGPQLLAALKSDGIEAITLKNQIKTEIGWNYLVNGRFHTKAAVGKAQVDATMEKIVADGLKPQYEVSSIFLDYLSHEGPEKARLGAQQLYEQLQEGKAPFQAVARQFSNAPSAQRGGDEGWWVSGQIDPKLEAVLAGMQKNALSAPIVTDEGVYILYLRDQNDGNSDQVLGLRQAAIALPNDASASRLKEASAELVSFHSRTGSCDALNQNRGSGNVRVVDLGETNLSDLKPEFAEALRNVKLNDTSVPLRTTTGLNLFYVCNKRLAGDNAPTREMVEDHMVQERVAMLGRRYLRDLRQTATIESHQ